MPGTRQPGQSGMGVKVEETSIDQRKASVFRFPGVGEVGGTRGRNESPATAFL